MARNLLAVTIFPLLKISLFMNTLISCFYFRHREQRQSMKEERKERKLQKRKKKISRFPSKPEVLVREGSLEKRRVSRVWSKSSLSDGTQRKKI